MPKPETFFSGIIALAAVAMASTYVYRQFRPLPMSTATATATAANTEKPSYLPNWRNLFAAGVRTGPANPKVEIIEFSDLECPFCSLSHEGVRELMQRYPENVAYTFIHFPLPSHKAARPAAQ